MAYAQRALDLVGEDDHLGRGAAAALLGLAYWTNGDLDAAHRWYTDGMASLEKAGYLSDLVGGAITQADIRIAQGRLREAMTRYERGLQMATEQAGTVLRGAADMHVGMSRSCVNAMISMPPCSTCGRARSWANLRACRRTAIAGGSRWRGSGRLKEIWTARRPAQRGAAGVRGDFSPERPADPRLASTGVDSAGRLGDALGWARERDLSVDDDLSYLREFEHITLARVLLAQYPTERAQGVLQDATRLLERLPRAAEDGKRNGSVLGIVVLQALAHQARGDMRAALASLQRALTLAEPEGLRSTLRR